MLAWRRATEESLESKQDQQASKDIYGLPYASKLIQRFGWCRYVPFMPGFSPNLCFDRKPETTPGPVSHVYEQPVNLEERM